MTYTKEEVDRLLTEKDSIINDLTSQLATSSTTKFNPKDVDTSHIDYLKEVDTDKWFEERTKVIDKARSEFEVTTANKLKEIDKKVNKQSRKTVLAGYKYKFKDGFEEELPTKLNKQLESGDISYEDYLASAEKFITGNVPINAKVPTNILSETGGQANVPEDDIKFNYEEDII